MAVRKEPTTVDELMESFFKLKENVVPTTLCKTVTNSYIKQTRHGIIKIVVTTPIKY